MKRNIPAFLSGTLTTALVGTIAVSALAASGRMTIEVDPINVQVNGEVFQPTDAKGNAVPVFVYQGTTYAPLRALAEAYGLEVGYDASLNMATVADPEASTADPDTTAKADYSDWSAEDEAAYQEFKGMWDIKFLRYSQDDTGTEHAMFDANCIDEMYSDAVLTALYDSQRNFYDRLGFELLQETSAEWCNIFFKGVDGHWTHHFVHY